MNRNLMMQLSIFDFQIIAEGVRTKSNTYVITSARRNTDHVHRREFFIDGLDKKGFEINVGNYENAYGVFTVSKTDKTGEETKNQLVASFTIPYQIAGLIINCLEAEYALKNEAMKELLGHLNDMESSHELKHIISIVSHPEVVLARNNEFNGEEL